MVVSAVVWVLLGKELICCINCTSEVHGWLDRVNAKPRCCCVGGGASSREGQHMCILCTVSDTHRIDRIGFALLGGCLILRDRAGFCGSIETLRCA
jgi:hypothetical protein